MFDRRLVQYFDWGLLGLTLMIACIGLVTLYSAVTAETPEPQKIIFYKQLVWFGVGLVAMMVAFLFNYKLLDRWAPTIYIICILLLLAVLFMGKYVGGSKRWLIIGPVSIQPSELVKLAVIIMLARYFSKDAYTRGFTIRELIRPAILILIPFVLIVRQPDLGTAMLVMLIAGSITLFVKIERRSLIAIIVFGAVLVPLVWFVLKPYQQQRILVFLNPDNDPLRAGYHIIQSKIAIGSGMLTGKGYLKGTQNALSFLPEEHTDFIFSVLAEEWGFMGSMVLVLLFLVFIFWGLNVAIACREPFGTIVAIGVTAMIFWQVIINIGMAMGLMPVVGVPLPFISYGGSSILTTAIGIGLLLNVSMRRFLLE
ncbi:MAG: rod shape-determining protein RodA [Deltaproteobacteria bacterium]|jgi:rod shape determining protein RodA|nr:rod shape-determining protein RodA [Deltaproteobacteria bacterium]